MWSQLQLGFSIRLPHLRHLPSFMCLSTRHLPIVFQYTQYWMSSTQMTFNNLANLRNLFHRFKFLIDLFQNLFA